MKKSVIYLRVNFAQTVKVFLNGEEKKRRKCFTCCSVCHWCLVIHQFQLVVAVPMWLDGLVQPVW